MTAVLVADLETPLEPVAAITALLGGFQEIMDDDPPEACLALLTAHSALETGNFEKMHRYNPGNSKLTADWDGEFTQFQCDEIFDVATANRAALLGPCSVAPWKGGPKMRVVLYPPHPWTSFLAFETAEKGMADHIRRLACTDRYRAAWGRAYAGDPKGYALALHDAGYMTADVGPYAAGLLSLALKYQPAVKNVLAGAPTSAAAAMDRDAILALVSLTMANARWGTATPAQPPDDVA